MGAQPSVPANADAKSIKFYIHFEEGSEDNHCTLKLTLPAKWTNESIDRLRDFFVDHYNKKKEKSLISTDFHLEKDSGIAMRGDEKIADLLNNRDDIYLRPGSSTFKYSSSLDEKANQESTFQDSNEGLMRCKNFGCTMKFKASENHDSACHYHAEPPIFHDTKKGWSCCQSKMVYDWEDFEKIEPCQVGRHCEKDQKQLFAASPTVNLAKESMKENIPSTPASAPLSIDDYNMKNPDAATSVSSATKIKPLIIRKDGKSKCINYGCQREYFLEINNDKSCSHHSGPPVFHDNGKYWSCCPRIVKYDFDEFLKIPGCVVSAHRDGNEESDVDLKKTPELQKVSAPA